MRPFLSVRTHNSLGCRTANSYKVDSALNDDGLLMSDHRPTFVDISF